MASIFFGKATLDVSKRLGGFVKPTIRGHDSPSKNWPSLPLRKAPAMMDQMYDPFSARWGVVANVVVVAARVAGVPVLPGKLETIFQDIPRWMLLGYGRNGWV